VDAVGGLRVVGLRKVHAEILLRTELGCNWSAD